MSDSPRGFVVLVVNDQRPASAHIGWQGRIFATEHAAQAAIDAERRMFPSRHQHMQIVPITTDDQATTT